MERYLRKDKVMISISDNYDMQRKSSREYIYIG